MIFTVLLQSLATFTTFLRGNPWRHGSDHDRRRLLAPTSAHQPLFPLPRGVYYFYIRLNYPSESQRFLTPIYCLRVNTAAIGPAAAQFNPIGYLYNTATLSDTPGDDSILTATWGMGPCQWAIPRRSDSSPRCGYVTIPISFFLRP